MVAAARALIKKALFVSATAAAGWLLVAAALTRQAQVKRVRSYLLPRWRMRIVDRVSRSILPKSIIAGAVARAPCWRESLVGFSS